MLRSSSRNRDGQSRRLRDALDASGPSHTDRSARSQSLADETHVWQMRGGVASPRGLSMNVLIVCAANICRSPMAEGALRQRAAEVGLALTVDSAAVSALSVGDAPDPRGLAVAQARGYDNSALRSRLVERTDFDRFDLILAVDRLTLDKLHARSPEDARAEIALLHPDGLDIPDPYHGGPADYEHALDLIEAATARLVDRIATTG
jgi:protein-tyrosine phosphatase